MLEKLLCISATVFDLAKSSWIGITRYALYWTRGRGLCPYRVVHSSLLHLSNAMALNATENRKSKVACRYSFDRARSRIHIRVACLDYVASFTGSIRIRDPVYCIRFNSFSLPLSLSFPLSFVLFQMSTLSKAHVHTLCMHKQTDRLFADSLVGNVTHTVGKSSFPLSCPSPSIFPTQRMAQQIKGEPKNV